MENNVDMLLKINIEVLDSESLNQIKGGVAMVSDIQKEESKEGDGAQYVCCIKL